MQIAMKTDKGLVRSMNQDFCAADTFSADVAWVVVCDGMGGAAAGDIASKTAVEVISSRIRNSLREDMTLTSAKNLLMTAITAANITVFDSANEVSDYSGMGTTIVASIILQDVIVTAFAGDSRAYLFHDGSCERITHDHSVVQELIDAGRLSDDEAAMFPEKNLITRALGVDERIDIDFSQRDFTTGDRLLLCTDGLTNFVSEDVLADVLGMEDVVMIPDKLITLANENGGRDNITAAVIAY